MSFEKKSASRRGFLVASAVAAAVGSVGFGWKGHAASFDPVAKAAEGLGNNAAVIRMAHRVRQVVPGADLVAIEARIAPQLAAAPDHLPVLISADLRAGLTRTVGGVVLSETEVAILARC